MEEYVARKYFEDIVDYHLSHSNGAEHYAYGIMRGEVRVAPAADVVEVKHGHWQPHWCDAYCSVCGYLHKADGFGSKRENYAYCPSCGSKMDEVV